MGPEGVGRVKDKIDGHFSFDAWPKPGQSVMSTAVDEAYQKVLNGKTYMMGVSPYFYTNLQGFSKNWYSPSTTLWFDRLEHMLALQPAPDMVQIISWNDFGESHYISDIVPTQVFPDARHYVTGMDHSAFRALLPYYIAAYKAGKTNMLLPESMGDAVAIAWYRTTPNMERCSDGGTVLGQGGTQSAKDGIRDSVNVVVITGRNKAVLTVSVGGRRKEFKIGSRKRDLVEVMLNEFEEVGEVKIGLNGGETVGPAITEVCPETGALNFNVVAVKFTAPWTDGGEEADDEEGGDGASDVVVSGSGPGESNGGSGGNKNSAGNLVVPGWVVPSCVAIISLLTII